MMKIIKISTLMLSLVATPLMANTLDTNCDTPHKATKAEKFMSDSMITAKIKELYLEDPNLASMRIHVKTKNRVVFLTGNVDTKEERDIAIKLAKSLHDVRSVNSKLEVILEG